MLNSLIPESPKQTTSLKILMVSTEYPPMYGGVGRYTANLTRELKNWVYKSKFFQTKMEMVIFLEFLQIIPRITLYY